MTLPDRPQILERERRWMRPAGIAAIVGVVLVAFGVGLRISALNADSAAEALTNLEEDDLGGRLLIGSVLYGLGLISCGLTLTFLFMAARDRSERVRAGMIGLTIMGVVAFTIGGGITAASLSSAAEDFVAAEAERPAEPPPDSDSDDEEEDADDRAGDAISDASGATVGGLLGLIGVLGFAVGYLYTSLWAMRTGLLSRFWGSLGMASAVVFVLLAQGQAEILFFQELWFMATGLMLLGFWVGGRPPAWETGKAMPWLRPGEQPPGEQPEDQDATLVEGEGREVAGEPLGDPSDPRGSEDEQASEGPPGEPPRKRKRRR